MFDNLFPWVYNLNKLITKGDDMASKKRDDGVIRLYNGGIDQNGGDNIKLEVGFYGPTKNLEGFKRDLFLLLEDYGCKPTIQTEGD